MGVMESAKEFSQRAVSRLDHFINDAVETQDAKDILLTNLVVEIQMAYLKGYEKGIVDATKKESPDEEKSISGY